MDKKYGQHKIDVFDNSAYYFGKKNTNIPSYYLDVLSGSMTADEAMKEIKRQLKF